MHSIKYKKLQYTRNGEKSGSRHKDGAGAKQICPKIQRCDEMVIKVWGNKGETDSGDLVLCTFRTFHIRQCNTVNKDKICMYVCA